MTRTNQGHGVELPQGHTGSSYFYELLKRASERYGEALAGAALPSDPKVFKDAYAEALVRFEAARVVSPLRSEIARFVCLEAEHGLRFVGGDHELPFEEALARRAAPLSLLTVGKRGGAGLVPSVSFEGKVFRGRAVLDVVRELRDRHAMTDAAASGLTWLVERAEAQGGALSLAGERFVLLGAGAELAPTELLLQAGAEVLWIDVREPSAEHLLERHDGGVLSYVKGGSDLLAEPSAIVATIERFAHAGPVHLWMYAYAGGASQEWRLTASMNAIARELPREALRSIAMLISPTTPAVVSAEDATVADRRKASAAGWKRALARTGQLGPGQLEVEGTRVSRSIVPTQGVSYQAAQYVGKILAAEAYAVFGNTLGDVSEPCTVSANVAPITATRSLSHPVFEAAFLGAPLFDILISKPSTTRALSSLLALHDVLNEAAPGSATRHHESAAERARALFSQQIHGGVYAQPFALEGCITVAALRGLAQKPKLALGLLR